jgi:hypothetical protein
MFRSFQRWLLGSSAALLLIGSAAAVAASVPYKERGSGAVTSFDGQHISFAGGGKATHLGKYTIVGENDIDPFGNVLNGEVTSTAANGETLHGTYSGTYAPLASGQILFQVHVQWQSGTGSLAGTTGYVDVVALIEGVTPGSTYALEGFGELLFD